MNFAMTVNIMETFTKLTWPIGWLWFTRL